MLPNGEPLFGEVAEWFKAQSWKDCIRETVSRVRISPSPPFKSPLNAGFFILRYIQKTGLNPVFNFKRFVLNKHQRLPRVYMPKKRIKQTG